MMYTIDSEYDHAEQATLYIVRNFIGDVERLTYRDLLTHLKGVPVAR